MAMTEDRQQRMSAERRLVLWLVIGAAAAFALYLLRGALLPFIAGLAIGYLLDPLADRLERARVPRGLAAALIVAGFVLAFVAVLIVLIPVLSAQIGDFIGRLPQYADMARDSIAPYVADLKAKLGPGQEQRIESFLQSYGGQMAEWAGKVLSGVVSGGAAVLNLFGLLIVTPVVAFYLLRDWDRLVARINGLLPHKGGPRIRGIMREIDERLSGFLRGQLIVVLFLGSWYAVGLLVIGLDFGLLIGIGAGLISVIPFVGNIVGLTVSLGVGLAQFDSWLPIVLILAVFGTGQALEGYVLQPKIVGDRVGLHPVWLMFAVIAGTALLGLTGALLAVPAAAVAGVLVRYGIERYLESPLYHEPETPPPAEDGPRHPPPEVR